MDSKSFLDQLLQAGQELAKQAVETAQSHLATGQAIAQDKLTKGQSIAKDVIAQGQDILKEKLAQGQAIAEDKLGVPETGTEREAMLTGLGKGSAVAGAAAILLGTKLGRRITGAAMKVGTVAAIGKLGYDTYQSWQSTQPNVLPAGTAIGELPEAEANQRSLALLKAMIAAAKADGHIDDQEQSTIKTQIDHLGLKSATADILKSEMDKALDVKALAQLADSPAAAVEMYIVSRLVVNVESEAERTYLSNLATALNLAPGLVKQLESGAA